MTKLTYIFLPPRASFALGLCVIFAILCMLPFHFFYLRSRIALLKALLQIIISPFGVVKFKHFFLADIMTSFIYPLRDIGNIVALFVTGTWLDLSSSADNMNYSYLNKPSSELSNYTLVIMFIPYWFRFAQSVKKYINLKIHYHKLNSFRYFFMLIAVGSYVIYYKLKKYYYWTKYLYITVYTLGTLYSYWLDLYLDWGLLRSNEKGKRGLRQKIFYPRRFYYFAMITNLFMRFAWIINLFTEGYPDWFTNSQMNFLFLSVVEALRRAQWALIRIENENVNNFERYRNVLQIPEFKDLDEEEPGIIQ